MANSYLYPVVGALTLADLVKAAMAVSVVRLGDNSFVPDVNSDQADLEAAETALTGYPPGGYPVTAYSGPFSAPDDNGVEIRSSLITAAYASGPAATIGFAWCEDADGDVVRVLRFDPPITLAAIPDGFQFVMALPFGQNL